MPEIPSASLGFYGGLGYGAPRAYAWERRGLFACLSARSESDWTVWRDGAKPQIRRHLVVLDQPQWRAFRAAVGRGPHPDQVHAFYHALGSAIYARRRWRLEERVLAALPHTEGGPSNARAVAALTPYARRIRDNLIAKGVTRWDENPGSGYRADVTLDHPHDLLVHHLTRRLGLSQRRAADVVADLALWFWGETVRPSAVRSEHRRRAIRTLENQLLNV